MWGLYCYLVQLKELKIDKDLSEVLGSSSNYCMLCCDPPSFQALFLFFLLKAN